MKHSTHRHVVPATLIALAALAAGAQAEDNFNCTLTPASTATYSITASAPVVGTMVGDPTATPPTRTKTGSFMIFPPFVNCGTFGATQNDPLAISASVTGSGSNNNLHPTGTFAISIDTTALTSSVRNLSLNFLGSSTASVAGGLSGFRYPSFCTVNPTCAVPFLIPISVTLGNLTVTSMTAAQDTNAAAGTLTAATDGGYDFSIPVALTVTSAANFNGTPFPIDPMPLPIVFTGHIAITGTTAVVTSTLNIEVAPPDSTTAIDIPPTPLTVPSGTFGSCGDLNLILSMTVNSTHVSVTSVSNINASGTQALCPCDWNHYGGVSVQDIFDFLTSYFGGSADFNGAGGTTVQDVFDFLNCYFSRPFPC